MTHDSTRALAPRRLALGFAAGAAGVLTAHQAVLWTLNRAGLAPWPAWSTAPTGPLGVPAVASAAFWGGLWGVALGALLHPPAPRQARWWARAAALGAVLPTAVGAVITVTGRGFPRGDTSPLGALAAGLAVNAAWGLATAAVLAAGDTRGKAAGRS